MAYDICRVCRSRENLEGIFNERNEAVRSMLQSMSRFPIFSDDSLPKSICYQCTQNLERAYAFKLQYVNNCKKRKAAAAAVKSHASNLEVFIKGKQPIIDQHKNEQIIPSLVKTEENFCDQGNGLYNISNEHLHVAVDDRQTETESSVQNSITFTFHTNRPSLKNWDECCFTKKQRPIENENEKKCQVFKEYSNVSNGVQDCKNLNRTDGSRFPRLSAINASEVKKPAEMIEDKKMLLPPMVVSKKSSLDVMKCDKCGREYARKTYFRKHMISHLKTDALVLQQNDRLDEQDLQNTGIFRCKLCGRNYTRKRYYRKHLTSHENIAMTPHKQNANIFYKLRYPSPKLMQCKHCGKEYTRKEYFRKHQKIHLNQTI